MENEPTITLPVKTLQKLLGGSEVIQKKFYEAAGNGKVDELKDWLAAGTDVNMKNVYGSTALITAAYRGHAEAVKTLLAAGADADAKNNSNGTALMHAAARGHAETIKTLLDAGANVNAKDIVGCTALMFATGNSHTEVVKILIAANADVNAKDEDGCTARGRVHDDSEIAKMLRAAEISAGRPAESETAATKGARLIL